MAIVAYPEFLQTRTYSAQQARHMLSKLGLQEGVFAATDFKVAQRGAGANMSVDVAAGDAWVQGDDVARQGFYHLTNDATINTVIAAAHGTLPRLDQIVLRVYDSTVVGVSDVSVIEVVAGTPTAGATLDTRTGAAALPGNCLLLADVLVGAAVVSITDPNIRDRRKWARGGLDVVTQLGGADYSTTSGSYAEIDATNIKRRLECSGLPVRHQLRGRMTINTSGVEVAIQPLVDGAAAGVEQRETVRGANDSVMLDLSHLHVLAAGSHTFSWQWRVSSGAGTVSVSRATVPVQTAIEEINQQNASNT